MLHQFRSMGAWLVAPFLALFSLPPSLHTHFTPAANYQLVDVDVTHQAPPTRGRIASSTTMSLSSFEVALFEVSFDQPAYYKGLPLPDLNTFLAQHHNHHHIIDDAVRLVCDAPGAPASAAPAAAAAATAGRRAPPLVVSTDRFAQGHTAEASIHLVPLASAARSRYQWLRPLSESGLAQGTAGGPQVSGYVNWNRVTFALLLRSWVSQDPSATATAAATSTSASTMAASSMSELVQETSSIASIHKAMMHAAPGERWSHSSSGDGRATDSASVSTSPSASSVNSYTRAQMLERVHVDPKLITSGACRLVFTEPHVVRRSAPTAGPATYSPSSAAEAEAAAAAAASAGVGGATTAAAAAAAAASSTVSGRDVSAAYSTRRGVPFAGVIPLLPHGTAAPAPGRQPARTGTTTSASGDVVVGVATSSLPLRGGSRPHHHMVHQHDTELAFLAESVDIQGKTSIPFLSILLGPMVDFVKEQIVRRSPDYIKWRMRTDFQLRLIQQVISTELFNGVTDNDSNLSILAELSSHARKEMSGDGKDPLKGDSGIGARHRFMQHKVGTGGFLSIDHMMSTSVAGRQQARMAAEGALTSTATAKARQAARASAQARASARVRSRSRAIAGVTDNPDPTMLRPDGCLPNPIIHHLIETITKIVSVSASEKVIRHEHDAIASIVGPSLLAYVRPTLQETLPNSIIPMVSMTLQFTIPPIVKRLVPMLVIKHVTTAVTNTLTRGVVHVLAPTLSHTLRDAARIEPICYYCYYVDPRYCYICPKNRPIPESSQAHLDLYTVDYFVNYYTDYYADFYTGKTPLASAGFYAGNDGD